MQRLKPLFLDKDYKGTLSTTQLCLRMNDFEELGDGTHELMFHMLGLFSFRQLSLQDSINFWLSWLTKIDLRPEYITIHPDKIEQWKLLYPKDIEIKSDPQCLWSDGVIGGYCTEFYKDDVEIGNIVNPLGDCIDCGFGLERIMYLKYPSLIEQISKGPVLKRVIKQLLREGLKPGHKTHGHVLKKLLITLVYTTSSLDGQVDYDQVLNNQISQWKKYFTYTKRSEHYRKKSVSWWINSFGVDPTKIHMWEFLKKKYPDKTSE